MRHRKKINHLSRKSQHRKSMLGNMASSLIVHKRITTTTAKAKALRTFIEPLITRSKEDSTHSRRMVFRYLRDKEAVAELFRDVAIKVGERPGGYTRIIKLEPRLGDNADMCMIELVDYNENLLAEKVAGKPRSSRRRRGGKKKAEAGPVMADQGAAVEEAPAAEAKAEEPAAEDEKEAPAAEAKAEEPVAEEEKEAPAAEAKAEEPAAEDEKEAPAAEAKAEEPAAEDEKKTPAAEAKAEEPAAEDKPAGGDTKDEPDTETDKEDNNKDS